MRRHSRVVGAWRGGRRRPRVARPRVANPDSAVHADHAIPVGRLRRAHPLHAENSDPRAAAELALYAADRVGHRFLRARVLGENLQGADGEISHAAGQPAATDDRDGLPGGIDADAAREKEIDRLRRAGREDAGVLEEEGTLLREEHRKPREIGALLVHLDLGEIGVVGELEPEALRASVFDLTYYTDSSQVEVDEQRTNLTRFPLF